MAKDINRINESDIEQLVNNLIANKLKDKNIAIYGTGYNAKEITEYLHGWKVIGLMDKSSDNIGREYFGYNVLTNQEVISKVEVIIIAASKVYWNTIYNRIAFMKKEHGIEIFFMNGEIPKLTYDSNSIQQNPYWKENVYQLYNLIDNNEVISFDIFDTLITRKIDRPENIFYLIGIEIKKEFSLDCNFSEVRKQAEINCENRIDEYYSIHEIYNEIQQILNITDDVKEKIKQLEINFESKYIVPRKEIVDLFEYCKSKNKEIFLASDMYLPENILKNILKKCNIDGFSKLLISCDIKKSKKKSTLWSYYSEIIQNKKCIHIGDDYESDIINPKKFGISTFKVMSPYESISSSTINRILTNATTPYDNMLLGILINKLANDPFALNKSNGKPVIKNLFDVGYIIFGPVILSYMSWFINELNNNKIDKVLFLAREGYYLTKIYNILIKETKIKNLPEGIYFKTSRRMSSCASLETKDDICESLEISYSGKIIDLLKVRFGVEVETNEKLEVNYDKSLNDIVLEYEEQILKSAQKERNEYLKYINKVGILDNYNVAVSDIGHRGTIQHYLNKITKRDFWGFYLSAAVGNNNPYGLKKIKGLFEDGKSDNVSSCNIITHYPLLESVLVAPEGMYIKCDENGEFVNAQLTINQELFPQKEKIHEGITQFILDMIDLDNSIDNYRFNKLFIDNIFGLLMSGDVIIDKSITNTFFADDQYGHFNERTSIWD